MYAMAKVVRERSKRRRDSPEARAFAWLDLRGQIDRTSAAGEGVDGKA